MMDEQDHYATLGVTRDAEPWLIQLKYRALMRRYHPDAGTEPDNARAQRINAAYAVLSDPEQRLHYDAQHAVENVDQVRRPGPKAKAKPKRATLKPAAFNLAEPKADRRHPVSMRAALWWLIVVYFGIAALLYFRR